MGVGGVRGAGAVLSGAGVAVWGSEVGHVRVRAVTALRPAVVALPRWANTPSGKAVCSTDKTAVMAVVMGVVKE